MKLYLSEGNNERVKEFNDYEFVSMVSDADKVIIMPGGMGSLSDMLRAIKSKKSIYLYNKDEYYNPVIEQLSKMEELGYEKDPFENMKIESDFKDIVDDINLEKNRHI